jgi:hypothetical protein
MAHYISDLNAVVQGVLASTVAASGGTFTVNYPSGTAQADFDTGLAGPASAIHINQNDKYVLGASALGLTFGASNITVTNNSTVAWAAGSSFVLVLDRQDGNEAILMQIPVNLAAITAAGDVVTEIRPGVAGTIEYAEFVVAERVTTAARAATLNFEIGTTDVTAMTCALTSANCGTLGAAVAFALPTGANVLTPASKLSVEAASVTAFAEGRGFINLRIRKSVSV